MIKLAVAAIWICAVTIGSVFYAFSAAAPRKAEQPAAFFGGLDYVKTDITSVPLLKNGAVEGYFLARLVYTIEKSEAARLSVPAQPLMVDELYRYIYTNPQFDFTVKETLDVEAMKAGIRDAINARVGTKLIHEVLIEQVDYLSKQEIRDNSLRRKQTAPAKEEQPKPAAH